MKLTIKESEFIHDVNVYLERGQKSFAVTFPKVDKSTLAAICEEHLIMPVWFSVTNPPFDPVVYKVETDFSKRYTSDVSTCTFKVITPQPFEVIHNSYLLEISENELRDIFDAKVKWYKENIETPNKPIKTPWYKKLFK